MNCISIIEEKTFKLEQKLIAQLPIYHYQNEKSSCKLKKMHFMCTKKKIQRKLPSKPLLAARGEVKAKSLQLVFFRGQHRPRIALMTAKGELHDQQNSFLSFPTAAAVLLAYQQPENLHLLPLGLNRSSAAHIFSQMHIHLSSSSTAMVVIHAQLPAQQTFL